MAAGLSRAEALTSIVLFLKVPTADFNSTIDIMNLVKQELGLSQQQIVEVKEHRSKIFRGRMDV